MYDYPDRSDDEIGPRQLDECDGPDVPYTVNAQIIPVNMDPTGTPASIQKSGSGSVQIQIKCPEPDAIAVGNGPWDHPTCA